MTHIDDSWGPWIDHDGKGCPCVGLYVDAELSGGERHGGLVGSETPADLLRTSDWSAWVWVICATRFGNVKRYRIRKPRGMAVLDAVMADTTTNIVEGVE